MAKSKKSAGVTRTEADLLKTEEQRRKATEAAMQRRRDAFEREERVAKINQIKIHAHWRTIMKAAKADALKIQLEHTKQVFDRQVDAKEHHLRELNQTLKEADAQYDNASQAHMLNVDALLDLQLCRLNDLEQAFELECNELSTEFSNERVTVQACHLREKHDLIGVVYRVDVDHVDTESDARHEYQSARDDVKNKNLEEKHALRIQLEGTIEELWRQFQSALSAYTSATDERKRLFEELKTKDESSASLIESQLRKLAKLSDAIAGLKSKLSSNSHQSDLQLGGLRGRKEQVVANFTVLKRKMNGHRDREQRRLIDLTKLANETSKLLNVKVTMAESILKVAEMNAKLETSDEKLRWSVERDGAIVEPSNDKQQNQIASIKEIEEEELDNSIDQTTNSLDTMMIPSAAQVLAKFQKRYNKVLLEKLALEAQREKLARENTNLREVLKAYLEGISISDHVLDAPNPLVVVNGKANVLLPKRSPGNITIVDGVAAHKSFHKALLY